MLSYPNKDPDSFLDYGLDWSDWMPEGDYIISNTWFSDDTQSNLILSDFDYVVESHFTKCWIRGGELNNVYIITNRIETFGGRTNDQSMSLLITEL